MTTARTLAYSLLVVPALLSAQAPDERVLYYPKPLAKTRWQTPMQPITRLADVKAKHNGEAGWRELVHCDPTHRHLAGDPPTAAQVAACTRAVDEHLDACGVDPAEAATVIGVAGTVTTLAGGLLGLVTDRGPTEPALVPVADVHDLTVRLLAMTVAERRALPWLHPGRADVIGAGALILSRVVERVRVDDLGVSPTDILDGIAWSMVADPT